MAQRRLKRKLSKKETKALARRGSLTIVEQPEAPKIEEKKNQKRSVIEIEEAVVVRDFADQLNLPVTEVIKTLMQNGVLATINESIDCETAQIVGDELGFEIKPKPLEESVKSLPTKIKKSKGMISRPPVVTVMGHVDHGKTQLLQSIRQIDMLSGEAGGITQHIGAYQVNYKGKKITFIDTPGHAAFEKMRAHGANITDIVILVVAADEGVKPQTIEAYEQAKRAGVPIIVAINKIDLPTANIQKVKQQLSELGLIPEDMGGQTICIPLSAKEKRHLDELLEMLLLTAEMKNFQADPKKPGLGIVIESHLDHQKGAVATVLIQEGTLREGDFVVLGKAWGKIRLIEDEHQKRLSLAGPSQPIRITGIKQLVSTGEILQVVPDEKTAQAVLTGLKKAKTVRVKTALDSAEKELPIVLKADTYGSLEAIRDNLIKVEDKIGRGKINLIREGVGNLTEDDVMRAKTAKAKIIAFKVGVFPKTRILIERENIRISQYDVIYDLIDDLREELINLTKREVEVKIGTAKILKLFRIGRKEKTVGLRVLSGKAEKSASLLKIKREKEEIGQGRIISLQIEKENVEQIGTDSLGGLKLATEVELKEGDILEFYKKEFK